MAWDATLTTTCTTCMLYATTTGTCTEATIQVMLPALLRQYESPVKYREVKIIRVYSIN